MLWVLTGVTAAVLLLTGLYIKDISKPPATAGTAALSVSTRVTRQATPSPMTVADSASGLSYRLLRSPWRRGCPDAPGTPMFSWTAGENAPAGRASVGGTVTHWYASACSGRLRRRFAYSAPADLRPVAMGLADALDPASGLPHYRTIEDSSATQVSGHRAWIVRFLMNYPDAARRGLAWTSEAGAVVVVDRGAGQAPAVFYASVPGHLGRSEVSTLVRSLRLNR